MKKQQKLQYGPYAIWMSDSVQFPNRQNGEYGQYVTISLEKYHVIHASSILLSQNSLWIYCFPIFYDTVYNSRHPVGAQ